MQRHKVTLTTDGSGAATGYTSKVRGLLHQIQYVKTDFANGVDFTVTIDGTAVPVWAESDVNASAVRAPRLATHSVAGVAATYDGTVAAFDKIAIANDRIKVVVAQGGDTKTGTLYFWVG